MGAINYCTYIKNCCKCRRYALQWCFTAQKPGRAGSKPEEIRLEANGRKNSETDLMTVCGRSKWRVEIRNAIKEFGIILFREFIDTEKKNV